MMTSLLLSILSTKQSISFVFDQNVTKKGPFFGLFFLIKKGFIPRISDNSILYQEKLYQTDTKYVKLEG